MTLRFRLFMLSICGTLFSQSAAGQTTSQPALDKNPAAAGASGGASGNVHVRYRDIADRIRVAAMKSSDGWKKLEQLCDDIGHRLSGSQGLERAVEWAKASFERDGHENVRTQPVMVVKWVRGQESLEMIEPQRRPLALLGLGGSVATPAEGLTGAVMVVHSQDELNERKAEAGGKIVLFDVPMGSQDSENGSGYGAAVRYRGFGARWASEHGAVAALVRSATTRSLRSPHTGAMNYFDAKNRVPTASVATEDAAMITRLVERGIEVKVTLKMQAHTEEQLVPSANVIAELRGRESPDEIVVIGGHLDSWDVGQGAHDDGGGCVMAMEALNTLRRLNLRPRRTIRVVLFTNEENGLAGGKAYAKEHAGELPRHVAAIEADSGTFALRSFGVSINDAEKQARAESQLQEIVRLLAPLGDVTASGGGGGADIGPMGSSGVPLLGQRVDMTKYFDYHHTQADTLDKIDPEHLKQNIAAMATVAYILADMPGRLGEP